MAHLQGLGGRIRIARKRRGLSAQALAEKVGVFRKTIEALEAGKPGVSVSPFRDRSGGARGDLRCRPSRRQLQRGKPAEAFPCTS